MNFIRLHVTAEGQTEEKFIHQVLAEHLSRFNIFTDVRSVLTSKDKRKGKVYRGGFKRQDAYLTVKEDIITWLKEDKNTECRFTTMFDLYALPSDFPGYEDAKKANDPYKKVKIIENAFKADINDSRFIPYIQLHEFEALLFVDPEKLSYEYFEYEKSIQRLIRVSESFDNPELINDKPDTAPSKRILRNIPEYKKTTAGPLITKIIGLSKLRQKCPHFNAWVTGLEKLL